MNIHIVYSRVLPFFRRRRMREFANCLRPEAGETVLDVGGTSSNWRFVECPLKITLLNLEPAPAPESGDPFDYVVGDGRQLRYRDGAFDIVFSNSVIEHLSTFEGQEAFAREARRVGRRLWVQTPARCFFIEPHLLTPFIHYLPRTWQRLLLRWGTVWGWILRPTRSQVEAFLNEVRLLTYDEMRQLFPDCVIQRERFLFMTKAYIAVRNVPAMPMNA